MASTPVPRDDWRSRLRELGFATPFYGLLLAGRTPDAIARPLPAPFPGDPARGARLVDGTLLVHGTPIALPPRNWFEIAGRAALAELHSFAWLPDLVAAGGSAAAAALIRSWLAGADRWHPVGWAPEVLGRRVAVWLQHAALYAEDPPLQRRVLRALGRQLRHLARVAESAAPGVARLDALAGLALGWAAGLATRRAAALCRRLVASEPSRQVLADGGHVTRSPTRHLAALLRLVTIREALAAMVQSGPALDATIAAMAAALRHMRLGDGGLALFNGSAEENGALIEAALARAGTPAPLDATRVCGFERVVAGDAVLLIDVAAPPGPPFDADAHAGTLSFELSVGAERLFVNCGGLPIADDAWRLAQRATAAHTTAVVEDTNSAEVITGGGLGRRPEAVIVERQTEAGATWIAASHDGYLKPFGVTHRRRLYVAETGHDLRGEDTFEGRFEGPFALRFHLHPDVQATLVQGGGALLRLPSGAGFRFQVAGFALDLEPSVYLGRLPMRRSQQLVIAGRASGGATVKWAVRRIEAE